MADDPTRRVDQEDLGLGGEGLARELGGQQLGAHPAVEPAPRGAAFGTAEGSAYGQLEAIPVGCGDDLVGALVDGNASDEARLETCRLLA